MENMKIRTKGQFIMSFKKIKVQQFKNTFPPPHLRVFFSIAFWRDWKGSQDGEREKHDV